MALAVVFALVIPVTVSGQERPDSSGSGSAPQGLRADLRDLFVVVPGAAALGVSGPGQGDGLTTAGLGFGSSISSVNGALIDFLDAALTANLTNIPFSSTNASFSVRFEDGVPVLSRGDPGPILAERAGTLGRDRILVAASFSQLAFQSIRGVDLSNLQFDFAHVNIQSEACDVSVGADCSVYGVPEFENDVMRFDLDLDIAIRTMSFVFAYGLTDNIDLGVAIPIGFVSLEGRSQAEIIPFGPPPAENYFGGTPEDPQLVSDPKFVRASASGVGDVAVRLKANVAGSESRSLGLLGEVRFPTGAQEDFLGSGEWVVRGLGIASAQMGDFSPHLNVGYLFRSGDLLHDVLLATTGFSHRLSPWATLSVDLVSQFQVGQRSLALPESVVLESPYTRTIRSTTIPDRRDDIFDAALGFKFATASGTVLVFNAIWPLNEGGIRPNALLSFGLEYGF